MQPQYSFSTFPEISRGSGIPVILTEDSNTLARLTDRLRESGHTTVRVVLLTEGFTPGRLENPAQDEMRLPTSPPPAQE